MELHVHSYFLFAHVHSQSFWYAFTGPPALTVNVMKNIEKSSIVVQWDAVGDSLTTTYIIITWTSEKDPIDLQVAALKQQTSYTITGLNDQDSR